MRRRAAGAVRCSSGQASAEGRASAPVTDRWPSARGAEQCGDALFLRARSFAPLRLRVRRFVQAWLIPVRTVSREGAKARRNLCLRVSIPAPSWVGRPERCQCLREEGSEEGRGQDGASPGGGSAGVGSVRMVLGRWIGPCKRQNGGGSEGIAPGSHSAILRQPRVGLPTRCSVPASPARARVLVRSLTRNTAAARTPSNARPAR